MPIYRIQYGIKIIQLDGVDGILRW